MEDGQWKAMVGLAAAGALMIGLTAWVAGESPAFHPDLSSQGRPTLAVLIALGTAFAVSLVAIRFAIRLPARRVVPIVFVVAVITRALLLRSEPILEVDVYRYIWDGHVAAQGVSPYRFSPAEVTTALEGTPESADDTSELGSLARRVRGDRGLASVLERVHFPEYRTPYPPVSQVVFQLASVVTPHDASVETHLVVMKCWILLFDLGTLWLVVQLLRRSGRHEGWAIAYGWCPLVLKEFANSGHLDSIAVFLTTAAVTALVVAADESTRRRGHWTLGAAVLLGLGVGAKLYPIVLAPAFAVFAWRRFGPRTTVVSGTVLVGVTALVLSPMAVRHLQHPSNDGLAVFVSHWEINDLAFMVAIENLKTPEMLGDQPEAWFSVVPHEWRSRITSRVPAPEGAHRRYRAFVVARVVTLVAYGAVSVFLLWSLWRDARIDRLLSTSFLLIAAFWFLAPTQNPWYWCWALPFVPFARLRSWLLVSGFVLLYYLRFWFTAHYGTRFVAGTPYTGVVFFDLVVPWLEFVPVFVALGVEAYSWGNRPSPNGSPSGGIREIASAR